MKFNLLIMLSEDQKVERRDIKLIELYGKYKELIQSSFFNNEELAI